MLVENYNPRRSLAARLLHFQIAATAAVSHVTGPSVALDPPFTLDRAVDVLSAARDRNASAWNSERALGDSHSVEMASDTCVLERVAAGDRAAAEEIVREFGPLVWSLALRFLRNRTEAEDATQEIFVAIWEAAPRYRREVASEKTFVAMIARRRLIDRRRKSGRCVIDGAADVALADVAAADLGDSSAERDDEVARAVAALSQLRPEERGALQLSIREGWTHSEIAERLQIPVGTVKSHLRRGVQRVRQLLGESGDVRSGVSA